MKTSESLRLDPWTSSSLLQKAIRRSEPEFAMQALRELHRNRGPAVFRRLMNIAIEDVGIADLELVLDVTRLALEPERRLGPHPDIFTLESLVERLVDAPKDRSTDYLFCAATRLPAAIEERRQLEQESQAELFEITGDDAAPLMRRANAAMLACLRPGRTGQILDGEAVGHVLAAVQAPAALRTVLSLHVRRKLDAYALMLPLLWARLRYDGGASGAIIDQVPLAEFQSGLPLYAFDKHTAVGKRAIPKLLDVCPKLLSLLEAGVPRSKWRAVTLMAAFYGDGSPVRQRFDWWSSEHLERIGTFADMMWAGSPHELVLPLLEAVRDEMTCLNGLRRAAL